MLENIPLEEAQNIILNFIEPLPGEVIPLTEAQGRVMAVDIKTTGDLPSSPRAAMDGYALGPSDLNQGNRYKLVESVSGDTIPTIPLGPGQTTGVVTGGPLPIGYQAVVPWERVQVEGQHVIVQGEIPPGSNIKPQGEDFKKGELLARRGTHLDPGLIGVLAAYGQGTVQVQRRPRVGIISLGPEVVPSHAALAPGQVWDSNGPLLAALVTRDGGQLVGLETTTRENFKAIPQCLKKLLERADLVLTIGGTASGPGDQALLALQEIKANILYWGVQIKPGNHSGAAIWEHKPIITLSGNPAACMVNYQLLAAPVLRAMQSLKPRLPHRSAIFTGNFTKKSGVQRFLRGKAVCRQNGLEVDLLPGQKSSMLRSLIGCNALIDLPAGHPPLAAGDQVNIIPVSYSFF